MWKAVDLQAAGGRRENQLLRSAHRVDAVGETRTGERLRLDAMCRHACDAACIIA